MKGKLIKILFTFVFLVVIVNVFFIYDGPNCTSTQSIDTSISVLEGPRRIVGLNADTDSLKFGTTSPQTVARRSVYVSNEKNARVTVTTEGDFSTWMNITPQEFDLIANEDKEVKFTVRVPDYTENGNYSGKVSFCFKE